MAKPTENTENAPHRHRNPLEADLLATGRLRSTPKKRKARRGADESEEFVDSRLSRKILKIGRDLHEEDRASSKPKEPITAFSAESRQDEWNGFDDDDAASQPEEIWEDEPDVDAIGDDVNPSDLSLFNQFVPTGEEPMLELPSSPVNEEQGVNLAGLILEKIALHEAGQEVGSEIEGLEFQDSAVPAKVIEVYSKIGTILSRYKSGRLPKPFKIIPTLPQWEEILALTRPETWSPNACYEATRIFVSTNERIARRFIETVLLERCREDIHETRKLNVHLFNALKKATFRPAAFFKGFLFPLVESGTCTLREAQIISSMLTRVSIPTLHTAAALMRLTDIVAEQASHTSESGGAANIFIRVFLNKKYALPYKVVDNLVFHFLRFRAVQPADRDTMDQGGDTQMQGTKLPVLWHQSLLAFAQRYRNDITEDQREALLDLLLARGHKQIGPEVRRELLQGRGRGVPVPDRGPDDGDDTMTVDIV